MTEKSRYWSPSRTYELILKIGKLDLTPDLISLTIVSSIEMPYQTFMLDLFVDPNDFIREQIYGQTPLKLSINLLATSQYPLETINFELLYLNSNLDIENEVQIAQDVQKDRSRISIVAVPRYAYRTMNNIVNDIYKGATIEEVITSLVEKTGASLEIDTNNTNRERIDQILIPPSTLYKNLLYLNRTWGIYNGIPSITCSYDNVVKIKNITNKMNQAQSFIVYHLAIDQNNTELIEKCNDGKHYYTLRPIRSTYEGSSTMALLGPKMVYIVKPRDRLFHQATIDTVSFAQNYGLISKNNEIFFDQTAIKSDTRVSYMKDHTGYDLSETFIRSNLSKKISNITETELVLERSLKILSLMEVGEPVQINSKMSSSAETMGKYILQHSELSFRKAKDWESSAAIKLIRTNRTLS
jgi:hypothetical protein